MIEIIFKNNKKNDRFVSDIARNYGLGKPITSNVYTENIRFIVQTRSYDITMLDKSSIGNFLADLGDVADEIVIHNRSRDLLKL